MNAWRPGGHMVRYRSALRLRSSVAAIAGLLAALLAWVSVPAAAAIAAVAVLTSLAAIWPAPLLGLLFSVVLLQDALVAQGLGLAQQADEALVLLGVAGLAVRALLAGRVERTPLDLPLLGFVGVGFLAALVRQVPPIVAVLGLLALLKGLLAFQLASRIPISDTALRRGTRALLLLVALLAAVGLAQRLGGAPVYRATGQLGYYLANWRGGKAPSLFAHHNALGHVCVLGGALALGLALTLEGRERRPFAAIAGVCLFGLLASASRESWLATATALPLVALMTGSRRMFRVAVVAAVVLAVGGTAIYATSPLLREEVARRGVGVLDGWRNYRLGFTGWSFRGEYRVYVLLKSWEIFREHVWLGTGPGRFGGHVATLYLSPIYERYAFLPLDGVFQPLDIFWSRLLTEFGLFGSAFYLWALAVAARAHLAARRANNAFTRGFGTGGLLTIPAVVVIAFFSPALEDPLVAIPFWGWAGLSWARSIAPERA